MRIVVNKRRCGGNNVVQIILNLRSFVIVALLGKGGPQPDSPPKNARTNGKNSTFGDDPVKALDYCFPISSNLLS